MKKLLALFASTILMLCMSATSSAGTITDTIEQDLYVDWGESVSYTHDINDEFDIGTAESATLTIEIYDDDTSILDSGEFVVFIIEDFDFDTGTWSFGTSFDGDLEVNALAALNESGELDVTVTSLWGDFYVGSSVLTVTTVPEPASILLMGLGLLGFGASRIRKAR